jgi:TatA/E family protein of Tat protein translocase
MGLLSVQEMTVVLLVALVLFGPKKLPELARTIGRAISEFRRAQNELKATLQHHMSELEKESESIRDIARNFNNDIYTNYYDSHSYGSRGYGSPSWEAQSNASASQPTLSQPAIEASTTGASATEGAQPDSPVEANEGQLAVNGTVPRGLPVPAEPGAPKAEQDSQTSAASPVES